MKKKKIYWENTTISAQNTIHDIVNSLVESGATGIAMDYDGKGNVIALYFKIMFLDKTVPYRLPCRVDSLTKVYKEMGKFITPEKANNIAWRQMLYWVKAQLAIVGTNMVKVHEVFLPYMQVDLQGGTLYESLEKNNFKMLENKG